MIQELYPVIVSVVVLLFSYFVFQKGGKRYLSPEFSLWNPFRRAVVPVLDSILSEWGGYAETTTYEREYVGTYYGDLHTLERRLAEQGFMRYPLASLSTTTDGRVETSSWVLHEHVWSKRQLHGRTFDSRADRGEGGVEGHDIYAHDEYTAHHPFYAWKHYNGKRMKHREGVLAMREILEEADIEYVVENEG